MLSSPVQTNGLFSSLLFHVMGDNLYSSRKTSESVPGKLLGHFVLIYTYSTGVAVFDVIIFLIFFSYLSCLITQMDVTLSFEGRLLTLY